MNGYWILGLESQWLWVNQSVSIRLLQVIVITTILLRFEHFHMQNYSFCLVAEKIEGKMNELPTIWIMLCQAKLRES